MLTKKPLKKFSLIILTIVVIFLITLSASADLIKPSDRVTTLEWIIWQQIKIDRSL